MKDQPSSANDRRSLPDKNQEFLNLLNSEIDKVKRVKQKSKDEIKLSQDSQQRTKDIIEKPNR